jgi:hypothetical protein
LKLGVPEENQGRTTKWAGSWRLEGLGNLRMKIGPSLPLRLYHLDRDEMLLGMKP